MARRGARPGQAGVIVFSHANGFPAGVYRQLFEAWRANGFVVFAIDRLGHDPAWPVTSNWPHLRDQLIAFIDTAVGGPVWLVGHSLGGQHLPWVDGLDRVARVVTVATGGGYWPPSPTTR